MLGQNLVGFLLAFSFTLQATAQYTSSCVEDCATQALSDSGCNDVSDLDCICSSDSYDSFKSVAYECVQENCPDDLESGEGEYDSVCSGYTTSTSTLTSYSSTETTDSVSSYTSYTSYTSTSESESSSYNTSYTTSYETTSTTAYNTTTPTVYSSSSSYPTTSYTSKNSSTVPTPNYGYSSSTPAPVSTAYSGAAGRHSVLPVAFVELMAVVVAMTML